MKSPSRNKVRAGRAARDVVSRKKSGRQRVPRRTKRPFVAATFAMTADGKVTTKNRTPVDFTSREDKFHLFRQRAAADAVLIGYGTLKHDNVRLGLPESLRRERIARGETPAPLRVIVSNQGRIDARLKIFQTDPTVTGPVAIFSTKQMPPKYRNALRTKAKLHLEDATRVNLLSMLQTLGRDYGVRTIACEGGPQLFRSMLEHRCIDQLNLTIAPFLFGGAAAPTLTGTGSGFLPKSAQFTLRQMRVVGDECFLTYRVKSGR